jgi:hypothetical protein
MAIPKTSDTDLRRELDEFHYRYPKLSDDDLFILWFLRAVATETETDAAAALCGGSGDKNVDAVLIDERQRIVFIVQGKYHKRVGIKTERRNDVVGFAQLAVDLYGDNKVFTSLTKDMSPEVVHKLGEVRNRIRRRGYALHMLYVTTGKCGNALHAEANRVVRSAGSDVSFELFDGKRVLLQLADYLDGVAPPVDLLDLEIESGSGISTSGYLNRYDGSRPLLMLWTAPPPAHECHGCGCC